VIVGSEALARRWRKSALQAKSRAKASEIKAAKSNSKSRSTSMGLEEFIKLPCRSRDRIQDRRPSAKIEAVRASEHLESTAGSRSRAAHLAGRF